MLRQMEKTESHVAEIMRHNIMTLCLDEQSSDTGVFQIDPHTLSEGPLYICYV
jgi:hypothetical protein